MGKKKKKNCPHQANRLLHRVSQLVQVVDLGVPPLSVGDERLELRVSRVRRRGEGGGGLERGAAKQGGAEGRRGNLGQGRRRRRRRSSMAVRLGGGLAFVVRGAHGSKLGAGTPHGGRGRVDCHGVWENAGVEWEGKGRANGWGNCSLWGGGGGGGVFGNPKKKKKQFLFFSLFSLSLFENRYLQKNRPKTECEGGDDCLKVCSRENYWEFRCLVAGKRRRC